MRELIIAFFKTGLGAAANLFLGIISTKVFALILGPSGLGFLSIIRQIRDTAISISTLQGTNVIVQGLATRDWADKKRYEIAVSISLFLTTLLVITVLLIAAPSISRSVINRTDPTSVFLIRLLTIPILLGTITIYLSGILNGFRAIGRLAITQVILSFAILILSLPVAYLVRAYGNGYFLLLLIGSSLVGVMTCFAFTYRSGWLPSPSEILCALKSISTLKTDISSFLTFASVTLIAGASATISELIIRSSVVKNLGLDDAGYFDAAWTLSAKYILLILASFGTYYLPTLSGNKNLDESKQLITRVLGFSILIVVPTITSVVALKPFVIRLLYSQEFLPALEMIRWMLIGDYLKTTSWVFGMTILASADKKTLLISEVGFRLVLVILSIEAINAYNSVEYVGLAFLLVYIAYTIFTLMYAASKYQYIPPASTALRWILGISIIISASITFWDDVVVNWKSSIVWIIFAGLFSIFSINKHQRKLIFITIQKVISNKFNKT
jgi:PST family polysaccharide transporter